jgi:hypothetical protein
VAGVERRFMLDVAVADPGRASGLLLAAGVRVDRSSLLAEHTPPASLADDATVTVNYDEARLAEVRQRQDFAMERVCATGAVIEAHPTSNRRIAGVTEPAHPPDPPEIQRCLSPTFCAYRTRAHDVLQVPTAPPYRRIWVLVDTPSTGEQIDRSGARGGTDVVRRRRHAP